MSSEERRFEESTSGDPNVTGAHVKTSNKNETSANLPRIDDQRIGASDELNLFSEDDVITNHTSVQTNNSTSSIPAVDPQDQSFSTSPSRTSAGRTAGGRRGRAGSGLPSRRKRGKRGVEPQSQAASGAKPAIVFDSVTKIYDAQPDKPALENVNLKVYPGEFVFLVGHSGSGKSTFIRLINRELEVTSGNLYVAGENLSNMKSWRVPFLRRNIGCVFQDFKLLPKKTAFENVAFALEVIGKSKHIINTQVPEVLRLVGLEGKLDKYPDQLSGGEQQRASIARAIVNRPPLLICDEPTGNLDPQTSLGIMRLLDRINRTGTIVLVATHDKEMVNSMRRRVVALEGGHVIRDQDRGVYGIDA